MIPGPPSPRPPARRSLIRAGAAVLALGLALGAARAEERPRSATDAALETALGVAIRPLYGTLLRQAGAKLEPGSPEWEQALSATVRAVVAARPESCPATSWLGLGGGCGVRAFSQPSGSMIPTLRVGDLVFAEAPGEGRPIERGDVVVFHNRAASQRPGALWVKRVIGLPGERVQLRQGVVHIDGAPAPREPTGDSVVDNLGRAERLAVFAGTLPGGRRILVARPTNPADLLADLESTPVYEVPSGRYFVLGDNRLNSIDSRASPDLGGYLPAAADIVGRITIIYASRDPARIGLRPR